MKRIFQCIISITLILASLLCVFSCDKEETVKMTHYSVNGLDFSIPSEMKKAFYANGVSYENKEDGARFCVLTRFDSRVVDVLADDATTEHYAVRYLAEKGIGDAEVSFDAETGRTTVTYFDAESGRNYYEIIIKSGSRFHHAIMYCNAESYGSYQSKFAGWAKKISIGEGPASEVLHYSESSLNFSLPTYMREMDVEYADICFGNISDGAEFFVYFYSNEALATEFPTLDRNSSVKEYADWFVEENGYTNVTEEYNSVARKLILKYVYEKEDTYYCDYILRNDYALFHVTMCCDNLLRENYESVFDGWIENISLVY